MSTQQVLKNRIRTATNILHIAEAMEVVASVQFRKLMMRKAHFSQYFQHLRELYNHLQMSENLDEHPLFHIRPIQKTIVVVITGDKGLCGAYNDRAIKAAENFLNTKNKNEISLILIGKKGCDYFKNKSWNILESYTNFGRGLNEQMIRVWAEMMINQFIAKSADEIWLVNTHFESLLKRHVEIDKILPLTPPATLSENRANTFLFEPSFKEIYLHLIPLFFSACFENYLLQSRAAELSSRMIAMKSSSKNAKEMIEKLTLLKNKNRQLMITNEILEITAGVESLT